MGVWEKVPSFEFHDTLPYGHGEKSVYIISGFMRLTREEAFAIRWHMGFSGEENKNTVGTALEMFPLALAAHIAAGIWKQLFSWKAENPNRDV